MNAGTELLQVSGLIRIFGAGRTEVRAVDGVDFVSDAGEITLIMGPSGSGKTTLLSMIGGLLRPTAGRIVIDGVDMWSLDRRHLLEARRRRVGFIFQAFNLLDSLTAVENVEIALNIAGVTGAPARERARSLLVKAGLEERLDFWARDLSGGERQRVAIARALANRPRLLLADEPTGSLDSQQGSEVLELLHDVAHQDGTGAVVVSHDLRLRTIATRVLWMQDGRLEDHPEVEPAPGVVNHT
jgi:putative ABC transport system ATP-binding protein